MNFRILAAFLVCCFTQSNGQELYGRYLGTEQGLLSKECYDLEYDNRGYLIVGTQYGPMKFTGEKFVPICQNLAESDRIMYDFELAPTGEFYCFNSKNKLFQIKNNQAIPLKVRENSFRREKFKLLKLKWTKSGLIIQTDNFFTQFYQFKNQELKSSFYEKAEYDEVIFDPSKEACFRNSKDKSIASGKLYIRFKSIHKTICRNVPYIADSRNDFIQYKNKIYVIISTEFFIIEKDKLKTTSITGVLFIKKIRDRIWLASKDGLYELDLNGNIIQIHFKGEVIGGIASISTGGIAVSLNQKGVFISKGITDRIFPSISPTAVSSNNTHTLIGDKNGHLYQYQNNQLIHLLAPLKQDNTIQSPLRIKQISYENNTWNICYHRGIVTLDSRLRKPRVLKTNFPASYRYFFISQGKYFCISESVLLIHGESTHLHVFDQLTDIKTIYQNTDTSVLLGCTKGIYEYLTKSNRLIPRFPELKTKRISSINQQGNILLFTTQFDGSFLFKNKRIFKKVPAPCLASYKSIWIKNVLYTGGNDGIYKTVINNSHAKPSWVKIFDGETSNFFIKDNLIFICYDQNLITKKLNTLSHKEPYQVRISEVYYSGNKYSGIPQVLDYDQSIRINIDVLKFDAEKIGLKMILQGDKAYTQQIEGTEINLSSLASGKYSLTIFPVINGEIDYNVKRKFYFEVKSPFSESILFYILIISLISLGTMAIRLVFKLQKRKRNEEKAELQQKLNEYKLLAVKAQVNPHFLSNGFAAIQALILKGDNDSAAHYLAKFSFLMRKILYYSETQFITVKQELQLVDAYLELELLRFRNRFNILEEIHLSENQLTSFHFPSLLLQPILENAIWHGLKFRENNPELRISLYLNQKQELVVEISDNGPGFNSSNKNEDHLSKGNKLITERIDTLNKQFQKQVAAIDILTSSAGTQISFTFTSEIYQFQQP